MTPERMAKLVAWWVRFYTRGLPAPVARRRTDEIGADVHDQIAHERGAGTGDRRVALGVLSRMVRGVAADASWRGQAMKRHKTFYRSAIGVVRATALILSVPLVATLITDEVVWSPFDFAAAGTLLIGMGLAYQATVRRASNDNTYKVAAGVALAAALLLVWLMGAVGIIGVEGDPADLMYFGVLAVGVVGAALARLRPEGMARTLLAMALVQALVAAIALIAGKHQDPISSAFEILALNGFFVALFAGSAWLFRHAARGQPPANPVRP